MKKVIITVISFILLLIIFDVIVFYIDNYSFNKRIAKIDNGLQNIKESYRLHASERKYSLILDDFGVNSILKTLFREPILKGKNSDNIFIFGCSYAYGGTSGNHGKKGNAEIDTDDSGTSKQKPDSDSGSCGNNPVGPDNFLQNICKNI